MSTTEGPGTARAGDGPIPVVTVRYFAAAREAAATGAETLSGFVVADVLSAAASRHGAHFSDVLRICKIWVNGEPVGRGAPLVDGDEVAVLPPVSGGCGR